MKALITIILLLSATISFASQSAKISDLDSGKGYQIIITKNNVIRVSDCGQVDKLVWERLNDNEDQQQVLTTDAPLTYDGNWTTDINGLGSLRSEECVCFDGVNMNVCDCD